MADFKISPVELRKQFGGYVDGGDSAVRGESCYGILRRFYPDLPLWSLIRKLKSGGRQMHRLETDAKVLDHVGRFYKSGFWDRLRGNEISDPELADELFRCAVRLGLRCAVRLLQQSLNWRIEAIEYKEELWITGTLDDATWKYLAAMLDRGGVAQTLLQDFRRQLEVFDYEAGRRSPSSKGRVFISYSTKDRVAAERMSSLLDGEGWSVWRDTAMRPGQDLREVIYRKLKSTHCVIVIWSKNSRTSKWVLDEAEKAHARGILVPIRIDQSDLPEKFEDIRAEPFSFSVWDGEQYESSVRKLLEAMNALV